MLDRFSIDVRQIFEDWRRVGGGLEEGWGADWRMIGVGLGVLKMAANRGTQRFAFFAFLPPYIGVSGSLMYVKR